MDPKLPRSTAADETGDRRARPGAGRTGLLAQFLPYQLSIASNAVSAFIAERYRKRFGLKITEWRVMAVLGDTSLSEGGMTQRELTEVTLMDKVAVNRACKVLEDRGLIARAPNAADGRSHIMILTSEGQCVHQEVLPLALETEREILADFTEEQQHQLGQMLEQLRWKAENSGQGAP